MHRPGIFVLLLLLGVAYAAGWWRLSRRAWPRVAWWRPALTLAGLGSLALALLSPLDVLAHRRFVAHMAQHMLLIAVAAPALLLADPLAALLYASYAAPPGPGGLAPLEDQALGGVVMWGGGGAVDMLAVLLLLHRFFSTQDPEPQRQPGTEGRGRGRDAAPLP